ncbi:TPA: exodeoxyribonuclease V subunit gamma [Proteus mirabilis]|nr:exodeoxyribonuclease V subunit gamma [Proteus mirabilis]MBI6495731.1 exodeoxyribonuclease V subunit gamma [Proteus mirabilis]HEK0601780.1 exodeoxyribonuclease V subunit gamma [Proteus mirabilis]HEK3140616.1 exodeoxyribonuclease V subunit gamma [Proteus mirabilis]
MFHIYHSNQLSLLKSLMVHFMQNRPLSSPFEQEVILVQSPGMSQWLQIQLAESLGIAANIRYPLPATFIWEMFTRVLSGIPKESAFSKDAMTWKLMALLPNYLDDPAFKPLLHYLKDDEDKRKLHQLAGRVADLFDQYLVYRPDWLSAWENDQLIDGLSDNQYWQKTLWLALQRYTEDLAQPKWHRANLYQQFISTLNDAPVGALAHCFPSRIFICGISALPQVYLQALQAIGRHTEIYLLFTNPCRYYWGDIQDPKFLARLNSRKPRHYQQLHELPWFKDEQNASTLFNEEGEQNVGNPLLASWGKLGKDNLYFLSELEYSDVLDAFVDIPRDNLLHQLQADILDLEDFSQIGQTLEDYQSSEKKRIIANDDHSLTFHASHSPQREVEVLQDQLLHLLEQDADLLPRDIIVMVADIDSYTPYIQAVFGNAPAERYIPFAISDRKARQVHPVLQAFITLLELPQSRFTAEQVLALLEVPALAAHFAIFENELKLLRRWVEESGIRWGLDDENVASFLLPVTGKNTWEFGLLRMLLGYAMDSEAGPWQGVLPYDESSGLVAELAGHLADFLYTLSEWRTRLSETRNLEEWLDIGQQLVDAFFDTDEETELVLALITQQWQKVIKNGLEAHYQHEIPLVLIRDELTVRFDDEKISQRFLAGSLNFCTLMPMRSIPFKAVCLLGMNDGVYPRNIQPLGFDLMAEKRRRGDRKRRDDDRYLFLEALSSAEKYLYISYIGKSIRDDRECNPSVLIKELQDYIGQNFRLREDASLNVDDSAQRIISHLLTQHSRVPFAPENFKTDALYRSYAAEWLPAASGKGTAHQAFSTPLNKKIEKVSLDELSRFYRHPVRAFFQQSLKTNFVIEETELPEEEPFVINALQRYLLNQWLLKALIEGTSTEALYERIKAAGKLPASAFGQIYWEQQIETLQPLAEKVRSERLATHSVTIEYQFNTIPLIGRLNEVQADGLLRWRPATLTANDLLQLWIEHLVYCLSGGTGESRFYGRKESQWCLSPVSADIAYSTLERLIQDYQTGMNTPLALFANSGWAWLQACFDKKTQTFLFDDEEIQNKAELVLTQYLTDSYNREGEMNDIYIQRVFHQLDAPFLEAVKQTTLAIFKPIIPFIKK